MEALFLLGIVSLVLWMIKGAVEARAEDQSTSNSPSFYLSVKTGIKTFGDISIKVFEPSISGRLIVPNDNYAVRYCVTAMDITDGDYEPKPLLCTIDELQLHDSMVFGYQSPLSTIPYRAAVIREPIKIIAVPVDALMFPAKGRRRVRFVATVFSASTGDALVSADCGLDYNNPNPGYLDLREKRARADELTVRLAVAVSAADGEIDEREGRVVQAWIRKRISAVPDSEQSGVKTRLNAAVASAFQEAQRGGPADIQNLCSQLVDLSSLADRYDILELCMKVTSADGIARESELALMHNISRMLDVNLDRFRAMFDKIVPVTIHEVEDVNRLLSIPANASTTEKKEHLRKEFRKWNARVTHSDLEVRKQAAKMLDLIAAARSVLDR